MSNNSRCNYSQGIVSNVQHTRRAKATGHVQQKYDEICRNRRTIGNQVPSRWTKSATKCCVWWSKSTHTFDVQAKNAGKAGRVYLYRNRNFRFRGDGGGGNTPRGGGEKFIFAWNVQICNKILCYIFRVLGLSEINYWANLSYRNFPNNLEVLNGVQKGQLIKRNEMINLMKWYDDT